MVGEIKVRDLVLKTVGLALASCLVGSLTWGQQVRPRGAAMGDPGSLQIQVPWWRYLQGHSHKDESMLAEMRRMIKP